MAKYKPWPGSKDYTVWGPVYDEPKWTDDPWPKPGKFYLKLETGQADEELADWERELLGEEPMPTISPAAVTPPVSYADQLEEFLDWTSWEMQFGTLEFHGILKMRGGYPRTEAEARIALMVSFDRLCHKLVEMKAPLFSHPEFHITEDGNGILRGETTIRLYNVPEYTPIS